MSLSPLPDNPEKPWFQQPFVWMVIGIPLSSVIVGMVMLWLSIVSFDGMVADDYYKQGLQINRVLDRERAALAAQLSGTFTLHETQSRLSLASADSAYRLPARVQVQLSYATSAGQDQTFTMVRADEQAADEYRGPALTLPQGRWYVYVSSVDELAGTQPPWRLNGVLSTPGDGVVLVRPTQGGD